MRLARLVAAGLLLGAAVSFATALLRPRPVQHRSTQPRQIPHRPIPHHVTPVTDLTEADLTEADLTHTGPGVVAGVR